VALDIYKKGQGKYTRLCTAFGAAIVVGIGCLQIYTMLENTNLGPWFKTMIPAGLFAVAGFLIFWLLNKISVADFMISAEGEMKKVSWSSRKEITVSTFIVIAVMIIMAVLLGITDISFKLFFMWLLG
jgi:preprotein translocase SecE subunit